MCVSDLLVAQGLVTSDSYVPMPAVSAALACECRSAKVCTQTISFLLDGFLPGFAVDALLCISLAWPHCQLALSAVRARDLGSQLVELRLLTHFA